jgi:hypothetical protein
MTYGRLLAIEDNKKTASGSPSIYSCSATDFYITTRLITGTVTSFVALFYLSEVVYFKKAVVFAFFTKLTIFNHVCISNISFHLHYPTVLSLYREEIRFYCKNQQ